MSGFVSFVSSGPGDPELLTLKARRLLHEADVVVHDRLVPPAILELARREARIVETAAAVLICRWLRIHQDWSCTKIASPLRRLKAPSGNASRIGCGRMSP